MDRHTRRRFLRDGLALAGLGLLAGCGILPPQAQQPAKVPRIGYLHHELAPATFGSGSSMSAFLLTTAEELGLAIPQSVLLQATEVIE